MYTMYTYVYKSPIQNIKDYICIYISIEKLLLLGIHDYIEPLQQ